MKKRKPYLSVVGFDSRVADTEKPFNGKVGQRMVKNPNHETQPNTPYLTVSTALRDSPLSRMHVRRQISEHQFAAGEHVQELFERAEIGNLQAMNPMKEGVDGGGQFCEPNLDRQADAKAKLYHARTELGSTSFELVRDVLAYRVFIEQAATARGDSSQRGKDYWARRMRTSLDELAVLFGFKGTARKAKRIRDTFSDLARDATNPKLHAAIRAAREAA